MKTNPAATTAPGGEVSRTIRGSELRVGDVIEVFGGRRDVITGLRPYDGSLAYLWDGKARLAEFAMSGEKTIEPQHDYEVFARGVQS